MYTLYAYVRVYTKIGASGFDRYCDDGMCLCVCVCVCVRVSVDMWVYGKIGTTHIAYIEDIQGV